MFICSVAKIAAPINKLAEWQYITVGRTSYMDANGMTWNDDNLYTILPI